MSDSVSMRPSEKVRAHLLQYQRQGRMTPGARLPTADELAETLGVSPGTVKNVYRALAAEGRVRTRVGAGSFWIGGEETPEVLRIGIGVEIAEPGEARWWKRDAWSGPVFGGILEGQLEHGPKVALESCPGLHGMSARQWAARLETLDGVIFLSLRPLPVPLRDGRGRLVPHVTLNPPGELVTANFVSPDYFESSYRLGEIWRQAGRRRVLMVTHVDLEDSPSTRLRYSGLLCGLGDAIGNPAQVRLFNVRAGEESVADRLGGFLRQGWVPDAIYTTGGALVFDVMDALSASGISVPESCCVVSGSGYDLTNFTGHLPVTTMIHPLAEVGRALLAMLRRRIASGGRDEPALYLPVPFRIGNSTSPEENERFTRYSRALLSGSPAPNADPL